MIMLESPPRPGSCPAGADAWFRTSVLPHVPALRRYLRGRFPLTNDIDDVLQETYLRLLRCHARSPVHAARALLYTIARNLALDHLRRQRRAPFVDLTYEQACQVESGQPSPAERTARKQESALLHAAITTLPERMREALRLRHVERLTTAAAAARLGVSVRTVEHQLAAARRRCAGMLLAASACSEAARKTHRSRSRLGFQGGEVFKGFFAG